MSLSKRRIGRRAMGVVVAASLMVLGLEGTAFAQLAITSFTPTSGPDNCLIVVTGTDFSNPNVSDVEINNVDAAFSVQSDTELWVAANGQTGFIEVTKAATGETVSSTTQFSDTSGAGACAPAITSFLPTCGTVGTTVTVTGTNLASFTPATATTPAAFSGGRVEFSPFTATATDPAVGVTATPTGATVTPTTLTVLVPTGAADGRIQVTTGAGDVFSTTSFDVVTDPTQCVAQPGEEHARSISLSLRKHLVARGTVTSTEDPAVTECVAGVPVKIQRRRAGAWKNVGTTTTSDTGTYKRRIKDKPGKYRAVAPAVTLEDDSVCLKAVSPRVRHRH